VLASAIRRWRARTPLCSTRDKCVSRSAATTSARSSSSSGALRSSCPSRRRTGRSAAADRASRGASGRRRRCKEAVILDRHHTLVEHAGDVERTPEARAIGLVAEARVAFSCGLQGRGLRPRIDDAREIADVVREQVEADSAATTSRRVRETGTSPLRVRALRRVALQSSRGIRPHPPSTVRGPARRRAPKTTLRRARQRLVAVREDRAETSRGRAQRSHRPRRSRPSRRPRLPFPPRMMADACVHVGRAERGDREVVRREE